MTTETLDKLYAEWSQYTTARTAREVEAADLLYRAGMQLDDKDLVRLCGVLAARLNPRSKNNAEALFERWKQLDRTTERKL